MKIVKNEEELEKTLSTEPDKCVFIHTSNCLIYCYQCDLEILDSDLKPKRKKNNTNDKSTKKINSFLELRKLFSYDLKKNGNVVVMKNLKSVNTGILDNDLFPLQSLLNSLISLYSIDYIRKILKKKSLANYYCINNYGVKLFPNSVSGICDGVFYLGRENVNPTTFDELYASLVKQDPSLSSYRYQNLHVV